MDIVKVNGKIEPCCADESNRELVNSWPVHAEIMGQAATGTAYHQRCKVCGRNHRGIVGNPIKIGVKGC